MTESGMTKTDFTLDELKEMRKKVTDRWEGKIDIPFEPISLEELKKQRKITTERWDFWIKQWE
jgi:hypothetical protein